MKTKKRKTIFIIDQIPESIFDEVVTSLLDIESTGVRLRFKADGRVSQPIQDFPDEERIAREVN